MGHPQRDGMHHRITFDSVNTPPYQPRLNTTSPTTSQGSQGTSNVFSMRRKHASDAETGKLRGLRGLEGQAQGMLQHIQEEAGGQIPTEQ